MEIGRSLAKIIEVIVFFSMEHMVRIRYIAQTCWRRTQITPMNAGYRKRNE